ncbi:hypothetical protein HanRHA438_Chr02g0048081 [Helianthus annuus]|nr:hypothetical protein HanIR_Chr02g0052181 [Helianthus annuus]KAJ0938282.1 hypothetical protein HanRHA438_Chr02g0048081 [Helianthus annuus]
MVVGCCVHRRKNFKRQSLRSYISPLKKNGVAMNHTWMVNIQTDSNGMLRLRHQFTATVLLGGCGDGCGCNGTGQGTGMVNLTAADRSSGERKWPRRNTMAVWL